ncbi:hypothetical protein [Halalkalicoccus jeotgali]|uniref:Uncharacterized protein n=1 Tax=Halalkalicoccus jeotgali (strain DSM 18796 / CECT 7217 / JCM 14584 / KCTC 4019 / B3) TaxID=795797 RepID=D8J5R2_HALJB|nr:hypothetical protein [Halalkalicoccus jeotgali]ADJ13718.1 hypothetical protein HacjB3_01625 [Halalkalicoccus jeotgali B3]ELY34235.1 hypothetical protein C497_17697 [Halalkalicoccus jeotgali B3]
MYNINVTPSPPVSTLADDRFRSADDRREVFRPLTMIRADGST